MIVEGATICLAAVCKLVLENCRSRILFIARTGIRQSRRFLGGHGGNRHWLRGPAYWYKSINVFISFLKEMRLWLAPMIAGKHH